MAEKIVHTGYAPYEKQMIFHECASKFRAFITGVGAGKTVAGANEVLKQAIEYPGTTWAILAPNSKILNNATLPEIYRYGKELIIHEVKSKNLIILINGSRLIYLTADNARHIERLRGMSIGGFWIDEGALFLRTVFDILIARLREHNAPLRGIITTTPKGFNWLYWYFVKKHDPKTKRSLKNPQDFAWFHATTLDNPFTPDEFKRTLLDSYTGLFARQEIYGDIVGFEGQVYSNFRHAVHLIKRDALPVMKEYTFDIDWGFSNPMACTINGYDSDGRVYVVEEFYKNGIQLSVLIEWLNMMAEKYPGLKGSYFGYGDPAEPQFLQQIANAGFSIRAADNRVMPGINAVYDHLEVREDGKPRLFVVDDCTNAIDEFNTYRYKESKEGTPMQENPLKVDDHLMDAIRYGIKTHNFGSKGFVVLRDDTGQVW